MKLPLLEWIERSVLAVWEKIADFLAKDREARKAAPEHAADPLIIIPIPKNRTYLAFFGILMLFFILAGRTFYLQVFNNDFLQNEGEKRFARTITIQGPRGEILDRNGIVLASSQPCRSVWADPALVPRSTKEEKQQLRELAKLLGIKYSELLKKLDHSSSPNFVYLARNRDLGLAEAVGSLRIPGIGMSPEMRRRYPDGPAMAHIVGYTGADDHGQEGVELARDHVLAGRAGSRRVIRDRHGRIVDDVWAKESEAGTDVTLAIDSRVQFIAYEALRAAIERHQAKAGAVVVSVNCYCCYRNSRWHLHNGKDCVHSVQILSRKRNPDNRKGKQCCTHSRKGCCHSSSRDHNFHSASFCTACPLDQFIRLTVCGDDCHLIINS